MLQVGQYLAPYIIICAFLAVSHNAILVEHNSQRFVFLEKNVL